MRDVERALIQSGAVRLLACYHITFAINSFGSEELKTDVLARLCSGEWFGAYSLSEPGSGSE